MKKAFFLLLIGLVFSCTSQKAIPKKAQDEKEVVVEDMAKYREFIKQADQLYETKEYPKSAKMYQNGFDAIGGKAFPNDRYNAACSYALANDKKNAFYHLFRLTDGKPKYSNLAHITTDTDLNSLHSDKQWEKLIATVKANKTFKEKDLDKPLVATLDEIYVEDQTYRRQIGEIEKKYGRKSDEMKAHWKLINEKDSINLIKVRKILDERGWLGSKIIGAQGNTTLFLVIQHSDLETQLKYLPMMREAVKKGDARGSSLALLEDRTALGQGKRQIYGSQISVDQETGEHYVSPLIDPENVDKRRADVGLGKLADYVSHWDMTWDVKKHKERTAKIEAKKKK